MSIISGHSFTLDGTDFTDYEVYVNRARKPLIPKPRIDLQALGGADGSAAQGTFYEGRRFQLDCVLYSPSARDTQIGNIVTALRAAAVTEKSFLVDHFGSRIWQGRFVPESAANLYASGAVFPLEFFARDPWAKAAAYTTDGPQAISGDTTWTPTCTGEIYADPTWIIKDGGTGATQVTLTNETTSQTIVWTNALTASHWLKFSRDGVWTVATSDDSGVTWTASTGNITGSIPQVLGGSVNTIKLYGMTDGTIEATYKGTYG